MRLLHVRTPRPLHATSAKKERKRMTTIMYPLTSALLLYLCTTIAWSSTTTVPDVAQASFGAFDFKELDELLYDVEIDGFPTTETYFNLLGKDSKQQQDVDSNRDPNDIQGAEPKSHHLTLFSKYGQKYFCRLPKIMSELETSTGDDDSEYRINVSALLQPLTKRPCLKKSTGWWSYEYCHGKYIKQFHKEAGVEKSISLGVYENETIWNKEKIDKVKDLKDSMKNNLASKQLTVAYHSVSYVNGTVCDITGNPRRSLVKIYCGVEERLVDIEETETCSYTIGVQTPLLCAHPFFSRTSGSKAHTLKCSPIISQKYYDSLQELESSELQSDEIDDTQLEEEAENTLPNVLNTFLSKSGLFDSDGDEARGASDPKDGGDDSSETEEKTTTGSSSNGKEQDQSEEDRLVLRMDRLKAAVDSLYKRMLEEFEETEEEHPTKNLLKHTIAETHDVDNDNHPLSEEKIAKGESTKASQTHKLPEATREEKQEEVPYRTREFKDEVSATKSTTEYDNVQGEEEEEEETQTVAEYVKKLKEKERKSGGLFATGEREGFDSGDDGDLNDNELGFLEDLDDEALTELEEEINEQLQEHLKEVGLDGQAQVEVKVFNLPASVLEDLEETEDDTDGTTESQEGSRVTSKSKKGTVKLLNVKLVDGQLFDRTKQSDSTAGRHGSKFGNMLNNFLNPMTPERMKVQQLEEGYNQHRIEPPNEDSNAQSDKRKDKSDI